MTTPVIFRRFKPNRELNDKGGDVIAIFPTIVGDNDPRTCMSYQHVGQHGACNPGLLMRTTKPVDPRELDRIVLWKELVDIGYDDLVHKQRLHRSYLEQRRQQLISISSTTRKESP